MGILLAKSRIQREDREGRRMNLDNMKKIILRALEKARKEGK